METLSLDFNRVDAEGRVRIGSAAAYRLRDVLAKVSIGDRVLIVDDEGNQCEGIVYGQTAWVTRGEWPSTADDPHFCVALDRATWRDARGV